MKNLSWLVTAVAGLVCSATAGSWAQMATPIPAGAKPRVFISDSQSWEIVGSAGGSNGTFAVHTRGGARPQTAEIIKTFGERCPQVMVNNKQEKADYVVLLDHEGGKGLARKRNKVAVFNKDGDSIISRSTRSLGNSVQDACQAIARDWASASHLRIEAASSSLSSPASAGVKAPIQPASPPAPVSPAPTSLVTSGEPPAVSSSSPATAHLQISSMPEGADIDIDGRFVGNTPSTLGIAAGDHSVTVSKQGYQPWQRKLATSTGAVTLRAELQPAASSSPATTQTTTPSPSLATPAPEVVPAVAREAVSKNDGAVIPSASSSQTTPSGSPVSPPANLVQPQPPEDFGEGTGKISVTSSPEGAEIFVDSIGHGHSPAILDLAAGRHTVQIVKEGYHDWVKQVGVKSGSITNVTADMQK